MLCIRSLRIWYIYTHTYITCEMFFFPHFQYFSNYNDVEVSENGFSNRIELQLLNLIERTPQPHFEESKQKIHRK